jgi:hypothetical protein
VDGEQRIEEVPNGAYVRHTDSASKNTMVEVNGVSREVLFKGGELSYMGCKLAALEACELIWEDERGVR